MGTYLNPGNSGFTRIIESDYVDKTGLIGLLNRTIGTTKNLTCISRPRRFGKSYAAQMLCAYYDKTCDSHELFGKYCIADDPSYNKHLNKYDVIYWDMTGIKPYTQDYNTLIPFLIQTLTEEVSLQYPTVSPKEDFSSTLVDAVEKAGNRFVILIDEWDAPIREKPAIQKEYLEFLRSLFKNSGTTSKIFAAAYMTGILPIKKDGSQSAISDFKEYTMIKPRSFGEYVGFTENEVKRLCEEHGADFNMMKQWYDGYEFKDVGPVYNPNSVMQAIDNDDFDSYWTETSAAEGLMEYISKDYNGMTRTIAELIGGVDAKVNTNGFANDLVTFRGRDDVLTLMIHLGYLAYDSEKKTVRIPNEEIKLEFQKSIREVKHPETLKRLQESDQLFLDTIEGREEAVAVQIEKIHREETSPLHYNKEDSLRSVIKLSYYTYRDHYLQWEELPVGEGYADIVYLPKHDSDWPALVVELKWNDSAEGAIGQILKKKYPDCLKGYGSEVVLVGISYDKDNKAGERKHSCRIAAIRCDC
ncbi:MAG: AAA family ATPase [Lachnospiraceae bacterium]|nr:AAA family ATPase [Lachnospiraceae bacterium]